MPKKLWSGRFTKTLNPVAERFTESFSFDRRLAPYDIRGSIAHVKMLAHSKIIPQKIAAAIIRGLNRLNTIPPISAREEDIHMYVEGLLIKRIGEAAKYLHTGRSRNDQVQLDMRLYIKDEINNIEELITTLQKNILVFSEKNIDVIIPGFTHLQHAQPILLAHHLMAYVDMFERDKLRIGDLLDRVDILPLGSGALAGSNLPLDRKYLAKILGFTKISGNSIDSVSDRDYLVELLGDLSIIGMHLSRLAEELVLWSTKEFNFIDLDESLCTGSSLMPQKKNPDTAELLRAKSGRLNGNLVNLLTVLKGLPLTYNRDLQEDKPPVFDSIDTVKISLEMAAILIRGIKTNRKHIQKILAEDDSYLATDLTDYLVTQGVPFRQAHEDVGKLVRYCRERNIQFKDLTISEFQRFNKKFNPAIKTKLNVKASVNSKKTSGSTNPKLVIQKIKEYKKVIAHA